MGRKACLPREYRKLIPGHVKLAHRKRLVDCQVAQVCRQSWGWKSVIVARLQAPLNAVAMRARPTCPHRFPGQGAHRGGRPAAGTPRPRIEKFPKNHKRVTASAPSPLKCSKRWSTRLIPGIASSIRGMRIWELRSFASCSQLAADPRLLNHKRYEYAARSLNKTGRRIGGWMKAHNATTA
jgi:hypothetical protein